MLLALPCFTVQIVLRFYWPITRLSGTGSGAKRIWYTEILDLRLKAVSTLMELNARVGSC